MQSDPTKQHVINIHGIIFIIIVQEADLDDVHNSITWVIVKLYSASAKWSYVFGIWVILWKLRYYSTLV